MFASSGVSRLEFLLHVVRDLATGLCCLHLTPWIPKILAQMNTRQQQSVANCISKLLIKCSADYGVDCPAY